MQIRMQIGKQDFWFLAFKTGLALLLPLCVSQVQAQQNFGTVIEVGGEWTLNGTVKLSKGSSVSVGGVITAAEPSRGSSYIVISNRSGQIFVERRCRNAGECNNPIRLPSTAGNQKSLVTRMGDAIWPILFWNPVKYSAHTSRGGGSGDLREALIKLNNQKLDLSEVFKNLQSDRYIVRFEKLGNKKGNTALKPLPFEWNSQKPEQLLVKGVRPGLYRVSIQDVSLLEEEGDAWVLITAPVEHAKAARAFDAATSVTRQWGTSVRQSTVRQYLRAALEFITTQSKY